LAGEKQRCIGGTDAERGLLGDARFLLALEEDWSCLPWRRALACPGRGLVLLALEEGWSCLPWKRAGLACPGRGLFLLALEEGCSCLPWRRVLLALEEAPDFDQVLPGWPCLPWRRALWWGSCLPGRRVACASLLALEEGLGGGLLACPGGECREETLRDVPLLAGKGVGVATLLFLFLLVDFRGRLVGNRISSLVLYTISFYHFAFVPSFPPAFCLFLGSGTGPCV